MSRWKLTEAEKKAEFNKKYDKMQQEHLKLSAHSMGKQLTEAEIEERLQQVGETPKDTGHIKPNNQLTTLPQEIDRLQELRDFNLEHNKLTTLPPSMVRLKRLECLRLFGNEALGRDIARPSTTSNKEEAQETLALIAEKFASAPAESVAAAIPTVEGADEKCAVM